MIGFYSDFIPSELYTVQLVIDVMMRVLMKILVMELSLEISKFWNYLKIIVLLLKPDIEVLWSGTVSGDEVTNTGPGVGDICWTWESLEPEK